MTRKKRPYIPKVKGCYECSQRRIDCDGTKPRCVKCTSRGIACSGFGPRFRFLDGFSARRRKASIGSKPGIAQDIIAVQPPVSPSPPYHCSSSSSSSSSSVPLSNIVIESDEPRQYHDPGLSPEIDLDLASSDSDENALLASILDDQDALAIQCTEAAPLEGSCMKTFEYLLAQDDGSEETWSSDSDESLSLVQARELSLLLVDLSLFEPWKEFLLIYFSENIAPEMVVVDDRFNGWRHLILPVACSNEMVMDAVLTVSSFHLAGRAAGQPVADAGRLYARAIDQLLNRKDLVEWDPETRQHVILAIVVLLVAAMVNGMSDFPIVFQMLQSALDAVGGESELAKGGDIGTFLLRQIRKMRVYAAPLISQNAGVHAITHHGEESFDCLYYYHRLYPNQSPIFDRIASLRHQAFTMYLNRVSESNGGERISGQPSNLIKSFQSSLELFPEGSLGEHVLVWPAFIAALECRTREQQDHFSQFLLRQYLRNGFANILRALELLDTFWTEGEGTRNWPALLPELRVFIM